MRVGLSTLLMLLFAIFLEIYIIISVGSLLGGLMTIFLVVFSSVLGYLLIKYQTGNTLANVQKSLMQGQIPKVPVIEAGIVMFGGVLLMIPGFITDVMGILTLVPPVRKVMASRILNQVIQKMGSAINTANMQPDFDQNINSQAETPDEVSLDNSDTGSSKQPIEGEYKRED
ncbi:Cytoplasmic membrane protein FsxA [hydrothermal vent metagenome]|uniref:Cytoplasmic membrane protein FsxA n=1 Tax=hydrothermal vent metagenome TaxID=652676 RepID=A0A3B0YC01_9ZZZZ